jgi:hypothetical protein
LFTAQNLSNDAWSDFINEHPGVGGDENSQHYAEYDRLKKAHTKLVDAYYYRKNPHQAPVGYDQDAL